MRRFLPLVLLCAALPAGAGSPPPRREDYRLFRALTIDLLGRAPSRAELAAFDTPDFDLDAWIDAHTTGPAYAERLRRIYDEALRLEVSPRYPFTSHLAFLHRQKVLGPDGRELHVYYRIRQRRADPTTDGDFCIPAADSGLTMRLFQAPSGTPRPISQAVLDARTVVVKPWWLYADYAAAQPSDRYSDGFAARFSGYQLVPELTREPDGSPTTEIRVCKEEAQTAPRARIVVTGRKDSGTVPAGRGLPLPGDSAYAIAHAGEDIDCTALQGLMLAPGCGCGVGLERCLPSPNHTLESPMAIGPGLSPLGPDLPLAASRELTSDWVRRAWNQEAEHFLDLLFTEDRDFREVLTSRATVVNGPLAQFYRFLQGATFGGALELGYAEPLTLIDPESMPKDLLPLDLGSWVRVSDRGPQAAGLLTMPVFLIKYATRRARAHAVASTFLCRDFVASTARLAPSDEPDLTRRPGCATCHRTLEPLAAYFTRVQESGWIQLPEAVFPITLPACQRDPAPAWCRSWYDPAWDDLRGAHASPAHADAGPPALAKDIVSSPAFAPCVVTHVAESFLGRPLTAADDAWKAQLTRDFVAGGYRLRGLTRAILRSPQYREVAP